MKTILVSLCIFLNAQIIWAISVSGIINTSTTWKFSDSPIIVTGSILVDTNAILTIDPGVVVKFNALKGIQVKGTLVAKGTKDNNITFTSNLSEPRPGDWGNINFLYKSIDAIVNQLDSCLGGSIMSFCTIQYACGNSNAAVEIENASPYIESCTIQYNSGSAISAENPDNLIISKCTLSNNVGKGNEYSAINGCGISISNGNVRVLNNLIENNKALGSYCAGGVSLRSVSKASEIEGNIIKNNSASGNNGASGGIMVTGNTSPINISKNTISGNNGSAGYDGGSAAIKVVDNQSDVIIFSNTINKNHGCAINTGQGGFGPKGSALIQNNVIKSNEGDGIFISSGDSKSIICGNIITNNKASAIVLFSGGASIYNNVLVENTNWGIQLVAYGGLDVKIKNNNFINNFKGNFYNYDGNIKGGNVSYLQLINNYFYSQKQVNNIEMYLRPNEFINNNIFSKIGIGFKYLGPSSTEFSAKNNYWYSTVDSEIKEKIFDWYDDGSVGMVTYQPYLLAMDVNAPISSTIKTIKSQINNGVIINWKANAESDVAGYRIHYRPIDELSFEKTIDAGNVTQFFLDGIDVNDSIAVTSYDSLADGNNDITDGHESWYSIALEAPKPPTNVSVESAPRKVRLSWVKSVTPNIVGYKIFRGTSFEQMQEFANVTSDQTSFIDSSIANYKTYYFKIQSVLEDDITGEFSDVLNSTAKSIWTVDSKSTNSFGSNTSPIKTINDAINCAINGDTILVYPGMYIENVNYKGKGITLSSLYLTTNDTSYISTTIIDGNKLGTVITIDQGELIGFTLQNGKVSTGNGGGIIVSNAKLSHLIVTNNSSTMYGGGILINGKCSISELIVENNKSYRGGGIFINNGVEVDINKSIIRNNIADGGLGAQGGGIFCHWGSSGIIENCVIAGNYANERGGGIHFSNAAVPTLFNDSITNNSANHEGGGIYFENNANAKISSTIISNNYCSRGAGFYCESAHPVFINDIITKNGLYINGSFHEPLWMNVTNYESNIIIDQYGQLRVKNSIVWSTVQLSAGSTFTASFSDIKQKWEGEGNISIEPYFTNPEGNIFSLSDYSSCIGAGDTTILRDDFFGKDRPLPEKTIPDIGAIEHNLAKPLPFPAVNSPTVADNEFSSRLKWSYPNFNDLVDYFQIFRSDGTKMVLLDTTSLTTYTDTVVKPGDSYKYVIKMVSKDDRENLTTDTISITIKDLAPRSVINFTAANIGYNKIKLKWDKNIEPDLKGYKVLKNNTVIVDGVVNEYFVDSVGIRDLETYEYKISAIDNGGNNSDMVSRVIRSGDSTRPDTVRGLKTYSLPDKITLSWNKNSESDIWKYKIYRKSGNGQFQVLSEVIKDSASYIDKTVINEIWYTYAVCAVDSSDNGNVWDPAYEGPLSKTVTAKSPDVYAPSIPKNLKAQLTSFNDVKLTWDPNTEPDLNGYRIYRKLAGTDTLQLINLVSKESTFNDTTTLRYQTYYVYSISANDTIGNESGKANLQIRTGDILKPDTVRNLQISANPDKITITWTNNSELDLWKYKIYRGISGKPLTFLAEVLKNFNTYTDATVTNEVRYIYVVSAVDSAGTDNLWDPAYEGPMNASVTAKSPDIYAPATPKNLSAKLTDYNKIQLSWTANTEADLKGYNLYRKLTSESSPILIKQTLNGTIYDDVDTLLQYQKSYGYYLSAVDTIGNESSRISITIKTGDAIAPQKVQGFKAVSKPNLIELSWTKNIESDLWKYRLYRGKTTNSLQMLIELQKGLTTYTDNTAENEIQYFYALSAVDSTEVGNIWDPANEGVKSDISAAFALDIVGPAKPTIISSTSANKRVTFQWSPLTESDMDKYRIYRGTDGINFSLLNTIQKSSVTYTDTTVKNFSKYYYYVCGVDTNLNVGTPSATILGEPANVTPIIQQFSDISDHTISTFKVTKQLSQDASKDPDGTLVQFKWYVNEILTSTIKNPTIEFQQGTSRVKAIIVDNDGGMDSTTFNVNIDAGYYKYSPIVNQNAGISSIGNNYVFLPELGGKMQILTNTFTKKLFLTIEGEIQSVSSISQDTIMYLASTSKKIYSFDKKGISKWELALGGDLQASPTIDTYRNLIYIGVSNYNIFAVDRTTGKVKWSYRTASPINQPGVIIGKDYLLMLTEDGNSYLFRLDDPIVDDELAPLCSLPLNANLTTAPAVDKDGYLYVSTTGGKLIKFVFNTATRSGQIIWQTTSNGIFNSSPVIGYDGTVYLGSSDWTVYAFNGSDGSIKWTKKLDSPISTTATINEYGVLYIGTESGKLYAISDLGEILWYYNAKYPIGNATSYINGNILFSTKNGELFKVYDGQIYLHVQKSSSPGLRYATASNEVMYEVKTPQWGTYQGNNRRSGVQAESYVSTGLSNATNLVRFTNYPNPFTENTEIEFILDKPSSVRIVILDLTGRMIERYDMGLRNAGTHKQLINGSALDGGVYFYQVIVNEEVHAGKMIKK